MVTPFSTSTSPHRSVVARRGNAEAYWERPIIGDLARNRSTSKNRSVAISSRRKPKTMRILGVLDPQYFLARTVLLNALKALSEQRVAVIVVSAQVIYLHTCVLTQSA